MSAYNGIFLIIYNRSENRPLIYSKQSGRKVSLGESIIYIIRYKAIGMPQRAIRKKHPDLRSPMEMIIWQ